jgi:hypothetical protein
MNTDKRKAIVHAAVIIQKRGRTYGIVNHVEGDGGERVTINLIERRGGGGREGG